MKFKVLSCLIMFVLFSVSVASADKVADMQGDLAMRANLFKRYHRKHSKAIVNSAQNEVFKKYFTSSSNSDKKEYKSQIDKFSLIIQKNFKVDEMCLIDKSGQEISRIVFREIAPESDLSPDEGSAPFFKPSMSQKAKKVHIQEPYLSADSLRWVICYTTPIVLEDGSTAGFYHFEMPIYAMQDAVNKGLKKGDRDNYLLIVNKDGYVISDSREKFKLELKISDGESEGQAVGAAVIENYFPKLSINGSVSENIKAGKAGSGTFNADGDEYSVVYRPVAKFKWSVVLVSKE